jgi:hypothetical protein
MKPQQDRAFLFREPHAIDTYLEGMGGAEMKGPPPLSASVPARLALATRGSHVST